MSDYSCPFCDYATSDARAMVEHLCMAPRAHAALVELELAENEIQARWRE